MAKTYNTFTNVSTGDVLTATNFNNVLTNVGNYRVPPMCQAKLTTSQSISNTTNTVLTFASKDYETDSGLYGTNKLVIQTAGIYLVSVLMMWEANATGVRYMIVRKGATGTADNLNGVINTAAVPSSATRFSQVVSVPLSLSPADELDVQVYQSSGGALSANNYGGYFSVLWMGQAT